MEIQNKRLLKNKTGHLKLMNYLLKTITTLILKVLLLQILQNHHAFVDLKFEESMI